MAEDPSTAVSDDPSAAWLAQVADPTQRQLIAWLLQNLEALAQADFGELEPVGVAAPVGW